ncbi:MAG: hypothetical protein P8181_10410 [bacterium]
MPRTGIRVVLLLFYIGAVWVRFESLGSPAYPYYKGVSGANFRQTHQIIENGTLPTVDLRAAWPEGFEPARVKPNGVEYAVGFAYRLARPFTDMPEQRFVRNLVILVFSLTVFTFYVLTSRLWMCRAAGVFAAFLVAAMGPVIQLTNGREFLHAPFAVVIISLHLIFATGYSRKPSIPNAILTGLAAIALLAIWNGAAVYIALAAAVILLLPGLAPADRRGLLAAHLAAIAAGGLLLPQLQAQRSLVSWPTLWVLTTTAYAFWGHRLPRRIPAPVYVVGAALLLTFVFTPIRNGGLNVLSPFDYWYARIRYLTGKPGDPLLLSNVVRTVWTHDRAYPQPHTILACLLPIVLLALPAYQGLREVRRRSGFPAALPALAAASGILAMLLDRQTIPFTAVLVFPVASAAMVSFRSHLRARLLPVAATVVLVVATAWSPGGWTSPIEKLGKPPGLTAAGAGGFPWVSVGNADRGMARYLFTRTSARHDVVLATPEQSSLVSTFIGRGTVLVPGVDTQNMADRVTGDMANCYADEDSLYARCRGMGITYVLYSIDMVLDTSRYSPLYLAGLESYDPSSAVAYRMHFAPESLRWFSLVFENDNYRLFRVTPETKPLFITDHPPVYQLSILKTHGDDLRSFYKRIVDIHRHALYYGALCLAYLGRGEEALPLLDILLSATADPDVRAQATELKTMLESGKPIEIPQPQK